MEYLVIFILQLHLFIIQNHVHQYEIFNNYNKVTSIQETVKFPIVRSMVSTSVPIPPIVMAVRPGIVITGQYLVLIDQACDNIFNLFKLPECDYLGGFGKTGRGPNEFGTIDSKSAYRTQKGINLFGVYTGLIEIGLKEFQKGKKIELNNPIKYSFNLQYLNDPICISDTLICGIPYPKSITTTIDKEYIRYNSRSNVSDFFGEYPKLYPLKYSSLYWMIFLRKTCVRPDNKKFASFYSNVKLIRIYNSDFILEKEILMETQPDLLDGVGIRSNPVRYYNIAKATDKFIYAICESELLHNLYNNLPTLEIWDWDGNPIAKIKLDRPVAAFDITEDDSRVYFIDNETQDKIFTCNLKDFLK